MSTMEFQKFGQKLGSLVSDYLDKFPLRTCFSKGTLNKDSQYEELSYLELRPISDIIGINLRNELPSDDISLFCNEFIDPTCCGMLMEELQYLATKFEILSPNFTQKKKSDILDLSNYTVLASSDGAIHRFGIVDANYNLTVESQKFHIYDGFSIESDKVYLIPNENTGVLEIRRVCSMFVHEPANRTCGYATFEIVNLNITNPEEIICLSL